MITTERFIARLPSYADLDHWQDLVTNEEIMHYIRKKAHNTAEVLALYLEPSIKHGEKHGFTFCSIFDKATQAFVGIAGLFYLAFDDSQPDIEIGCILHKEYWRKGCSQELADGFFKWGFENLPIDKIVAVANPLNQNSWCAMEKKGMKFIRNELYANKYEVVRYEIYK